MQNIKAIKFFFTIDASQVCHPPFVVVTPIVLRVFKLALIISVKCLNTPEGRTVYSWRWERNCHNWAVRWVIKMGTIGDTFRHTVLQCLHATALFWMHEKWLEGAFNFNLCTCSGSLSNNCANEENSSLRQADTFIKGYKIVLGLPT